MDITKRKTVPKLSVNPQELGQHCQENVPLKATFCKSKTIRGNNESE